MIIYRLRPTLFRQMDRVKEVSNFIIFTKTLVDISDIDNSKNLFYVFETF